MKAADLKIKSADELNNELLGLLKAQFGLRMQRAANQLEKSSELKKIRRNIARVKTVLKEKAL